MKWEGSRQKEYPRQRGHKSEMKMFSEKEQKYQ
jgi:hypothetical protein